MAAYDQGPLSKYNSLTDKYLVNYFNNDRMRKHLIKSGLINKDGDVIPDPVYRVKIARREHRKKVRDMISHAIIHKAFEMERSRQIDISKKIEEIAKLELVKRVRSDRMRSSDEEFKTFFQPGKMDPKSKTPTRSHSSHDDFRLPSSSDEDTRQRLRKVLPQEEIDSKHLSHLDALTLHEYSKIVEKNNRKRTNPSPYLGMGSVHPHSGRRLDKISVPPTPKNGSGATKTQTKRKKQKKQTVNGKQNKSKEKEETMGSRGNIKSLAVVKFVFHAPAPDRSFMVTIDQQPTGGNTLRLLHKEMSDNDEFEIISKRHRGFPFSLTFYIDGVTDCRLSTCCESKSKPGKKIGGPKGHFTLSSVEEGFGPCYKCLAEEYFKISKTKKDKKEDDNVVSDLESISVNNDSDKGDSDNYTDDLEKDTSSEISDENSEVEIKVDAKKDEPSDDESSQETLIEEEEARTVETQPNKTKNIDEKNVKASNKIDAKGNEPDTGFTEPKNQGNEKEDKTPAVKTKVLLENENSDVGKRGIDENKNEDNENEEEMEDENNQKSKERSINNKNIKTTDKKSVVETKVLLENKDNSDVEKNGFVKNKNEDDENEEEMEDENNQKSKENSINNKKIKTKDKKSVVETKVLLENKDNSDVEKKVFVKNKNEDDENEEEMDDENNQRSNQRNRKDENIKANPNNNILRTTNRDSDSDSEEETKNEANPRSKKQEIRGNRKMNSNTQRNISPERSDDESDNDSDQFARISSSSSSANEKDKIQKQKYTEKRTQDKIEDEINELKEEAKSSDILNTQKQSLEKNSEEEKSVDKDDKNKEKIQISQQEPLNNKAILQRQDEQDIKDQNIPGRSQNNERKRNDSIVSASSSQLSYDEPSSQLDSKEAQERSSSISANSSPLSSASRQSTPTPRNEKLSDLRNNTTDTTAAIGGDIGNIKTDPDNSKVKISPRKVDSQSSSSGSRGTSQSPKSSNDNENDRSYRNEPIVPKLDINHNQDEYDDDKPGPSNKYNDKTQKVDNQNNDSVAVTNLPSPPATSPNDSKRDNSELSSSNTSFNSLDRSNSTPIPVDNQSDDEDDIDLSDSSIKLESEEVSFKRAQDIIKGIRGKKIKYLTIRNCELQSYIFDYFGEELTDQNELEFICISNCELDISTLRLLATYLPKWPLLNTLNLSNNKLIDFSLKNLLDTVAKIFGEHNEFSRTLKLLDLSNCQLQENDLYHLVELIQDNTRINRINLNGNQIVDEQLWNKFVIALSSNKFLNKVQLENSGLGPSHLNVLQEYDVADKILV